MPEAWSLLAIEEQHPYLLAAIAFVLIWLAAFVFTRILQRLTRPYAFAHELSCCTAGALRMLIPLIAVQTILTSAPDELLFVEGLRRVTALLVIVALIWMGLRAVGSIEKAIIRHNPLDVANNLQARRVHTQVKVLVRTLSTLVIIIGLAGMLMTIPAARQFGTSLLASAGLAGIAVGFAAKPVLGNLIAGLQIAITQPIRLDDVVIVEGQWGRVEEITGTYVVVRIWDSRRLVVPLQWFIENPFENWTRTTSDLLGAVLLWVDYAIPLGPLRLEVERLCHEAPHLWDGRVCVLQVTDCTEKTMQLRILVSTADSSRNFDLRCFIRENMLAYINKHYPGALPKHRAMLHRHEPQAEPDLPPARDSGAAERQPPV